MRIRYTQTRISIINIHAMRLTRASILNSLNPIVQEWKPTTIVIAASYAVVKLHFEGCVAVRVRGRVEGRLGDGGGGATVRVHEQVPLAVVVARVRVPVVGEGGYSSGLEILGHEGFGEERLTGVVVGGLGERAVGEGGQCIEPAIGLDGAGWVTDAHLLEKGLDDAVKVCAGAVVDTGKGGPAGEEEAHIELGGLLKASEVLNGVNHLGQLRSRAWVHGIVEVDVALGGSEGAELEVGDDTKGGSSATQSPEEVGVLSLGCSDDTAVGQNYSRLENVVKGKALATRNETIATMESQTSYADTWACAVANSLLSLVVESCSYISQTSSSTNNGCLSVLVDSDAVEVAHIDEQVTILSSNAMSSIAVSTRLRSDLDTVLCATRNGIGNVLLGLGDRNRGRLELHAIVEALDRLVPVGRTGGKDWYLKLGQTCIDCRPLVQSRGLREREEAQRGNDYREYCHDG